MKQDFDFSNVWAYAFTLEGVEFFDEVEGTRGLRKDVPRKIEYVDREVIVGRREICSRGKDRIVRLKDVNQFELRKLKFMESIWGIPELDMVKELYEISMLERNFVGDYEWLELELNQMSKGYCLNDSLYNQIVEVRI